MKLAKFAESDRGKRISEILLRKGRLIGWAKSFLLLLDLCFEWFSTLYSRLLLYCVGIGVYCAFPAEGYHRKKFFDENALLTGLVKREFTNATLIATLQSQYRQNLERYYGVKNIFQSKQANNQYTYLQYFHYTYPLIINVLVRLHSNNYIASCCIYYCLMSSMYI